MILGRSRRWQPARRLRRLATLVAGGAALLAAGHASAEPALWRVRGAHATVYLFGTIHFLHPDTVWHSPKIDRAFGASGTLYEELETVSDATAFAALAARYGRDPDHSLTSRLDDAGRAKLAGVARNLQAPLEQLQPLRPWLAALGLSTLRLIRAGYDPNSGVDVRLSALATAQGKHVAGFETLEQQIRGLAGLSEPDQVRFLLSTLDDAESGAPVLDRTVSVWSAGDVDRLWSLIGTRLRRDYAGLYEQLFVARNRAFAAQIETLVRGDGVYFVAIGAGHLAGPDSVQSDLTRDGFTVSRM
jgi:hypothetical protein